MASKKPAAKAASKAPAKKAAAPAKKAPAKKAAPAKETSKLRTPEIDDSVVYTLAKEECEHFGKPEGHRLGMKIVTADIGNGASLLKGEIRPGESWQRGAWQSETAKPGAYHYE
jgi:hypothetical protein